MKVCTLLLAALIFPTISLGGRQTTVPSDRLTIVVQITDEGMKLTKFQHISASAGPELVVMRGPVPRGNGIAITVMNLGKKVHDFAFLGRRTKRLEPGRTAHLFVTAMARGSFPYRSTVDKGPAFRGYVTVQ